MRKYVKKRKVKLTLSKHVRSKLWRVFNECRVKSVGIIIEEIVKRNMNKPNVFAIPLTDAKTELTTTISIDLIDEINIRRGSLSLASYITFQLMKLNERRMWWDDQNFKKQLKNKHGILL